MLEVGPGLGVLTTHLADRVAPRARDRDRSEPRAAPPRADRRAAERRARLRRRAASSAGELDPPPTKFVSNLPYNVATPLVAESLDGLPSLELWCVMVQREVADRFFSPPGNERLRSGFGARPAHGRADRLPSRVAAPSFVRPRTLTRRSSPSGVARSGARSSRGSRRSSKASFAHRRKTLVNSLALVRVRAGAGRERRRRSQPRPETSARNGSRPVRSSRLPERLA